MLDKNDRKYIIRRIITYISIAFIMVLLNLFCPLFKVKAITSTTMVSNASITIPQGMDYGEYSMNESWGGHPEGTIYFSMTYELSSGLLTNDNQITQIRVITSSNKSFGCQFGSIVSYTDSATQFINYDVSCPVDFSDGGLRKIMISNRSANTGQTNVYKIGQFITYVSKSGDVSAVASAVNDVNNSINNTDSPSNNDISSKTNDWNSNNAQSGVINQLVLMPITLLNSFVNGINGSCSPYDFGELWGEHIIFPCINLSNMLGSLWTIIDIILSGIFIFVFGKRCVKIFNDFTNLRSGQIDTLYGGDN